MALIVFNKDYFKNISVLRACGVVNGWIVHSPAGALVVHPVIDDLHQGDLGVGVPKNRDGQVSVDLRNGSANVESTVSEEDSNIVPIAVNHLFEISSFFLYFFCGHLLCEFHHALSPLSGKAPRSVLSKSRVVRTEVDNWVGLARHDHERGLDVRPERGEGRALDRSVTQLGNTGVVLMSILGRESR